MENAGIAKYPGRNDVGLYSEFQDLIETSSLDRSN
jgi:hypothetical protein